MGDSECMAMNDVGKPCAGKPHARFERGPLAKRNAHGEMEQAPDEKSSGLSPPTYRRTTSQRPTSQLVLRGRTNRSKDVEILVLRHQLAVLNANIRIHGSSPKIARSSPRWRVGSAVNAGRSSWSSPTRSCVGIDDSSRTTGPSRTGPADPRLLSKRAA